MRRTLASFLLAIATWNMAWAQSDYPQRPIRFVVPFAAGGNADTIARVVAQGLNEVLKQSVVVENRPGANSLVAATAVARSAPDGYTLFLATPESMAINPQIHSAVQYDVFKDFAPAGVISSFPFALVVSAELPVKTVGEFVAYAKDRPGKLNYASWGLGSTSQIAFEQLRQLSGVEMVHVPFPGAAPAITAVIAGEVHAMMVPLTVAAAQASSGRIRILGITAAKREGAASDIPTVAEQGFPVVIGSWHILAFPKGTPTDVIGTMSSSLNQSLALPSVRSALLTQGVTPGGGTPAEAERMIKDEWEKWGDIIRAAKLRIER